MKTNAWLFLLLSLLVSQGAIASEQKKGGTFVFIQDNDVFYGKDRYYTNGIKLIWIPDETTATPDWAINISKLIPWYSSKGHIFHGYSLGQDMFTPSDITIEDPPLDERPYAGWLYASIGVGVKSDQTLDLFGVTFGMVGPASLAEQSQKFVHDLIGTNDPKGWDTQLANEPGIIVSNQRSWRAINVTAPSGFQLDFTPHLGAVLGNVYTYANTGLTLRYGKHLPDNFGTTRVLPGIADSADYLSQTGFAWYLFAGAEGRAIARNIFLDGNSFVDSRRVEKYPFVGDIQFGFVVDWKKIRVSYTHLFRSKEFTTQEENHDFGALRIAIKF